MRFSSSPTGLAIPPALPRGGTIGVVAPASAAPDDTLERGLDALRRQGFRVVLGRHVRDRYGHLAGSDEDRAADLHEMFDRPDVDAIFCARGGSGSIRLLPLLDCDRIAARPKPFVGYSDITILELALLRKCGLPTFFGPMVASDFAYELSQGCLELLWRLLCDPMPAGELLDPRAEEAETLVGGTAEGPLVGGTLSLIVATLGTPYEIETEGRILFFEDVYESPPRVERYLAHLLLAGKLQRAAGFLIGGTPYDAPEEERAGYLPVRRVYQDLLVPLRKPAVHAWPVGHDPSPVTVPQGIRARLDADRMSLTVIEPAVRPRE